MPNIAKKEEIGVLYFQGSRTMDSMMELIQPYGNWAFIDPNNRNQLSRYKNIIIPDIDVLPSMSNRAFLKSKKSINFVTNREIDKFVNFQAEFLIESDINVLAMGYGAVALVSNTKDFRYSVSQEIVSKKCKCIWEDTEKGKMSCTVQTISNIDIATYNKDASVLAVSHTHKSTKKKILSVKYMNNILLFTRPQKITHLPDSKVYQKLGYHTGDVFFHEVMKEIFSNGEERKPPLQTTGV